MPNYYLTREGELVPEGDEKAAFLVHREGSEPDDERLESLKPGLAAALKAKLRGGTETKQVEQAETEDKSERGPGRPRRL
jgi:hypothetical protein